MPKAKPADIILEKTPSYFVTSKVPHRIQNMNKKIKLIVILRDPVARAISNWAHNVEAGNIEKGLHLDEVLMNHKSHYIRKGIYYIHLKNWYKCFPQKQFLLLDGHKFIKNPVSILNQVEDFLGVRQRITKHHIVFVKSKGFFCKRISGEIHCEDKTKGLIHPKVAKPIQQQLYTFYRPYNQKLVELTGQNYTFTVY